MNNLISARAEIRSLTGLRFVAAFYVFLFHIHIRWPLTSQPFLKNILDQGAIGMSLFFVLSGFVLTFQYANRPIKYSHYLLNRFARIYPIYVLAAITTLPWLGISFGGDSLSQIFVGVAQGVMLVIANIFLVQAWFPQFFSFWNDGGSWSISVEMFCYLLLPFALVRLGNLSNKYLGVFAAICIVTAALPGFSAALFASPAIGVFYSMPIFRLPEFLVGACACLAIQRGIKIQTGAVIQLAVIFLFCAYLSMFGAALPLYVGHNWITIPVISFLIFSLATGKGFLAAALSSKVMVWLGKISYCFYSFQVLLILLLIRYHDALAVEIPALANNRLFGLISLIVLLCCSAAAYYFVEEPVRYWIRYRYSPRLQSKCSVRGVNEKHEQAFVG